MRCELARSLPLGGRWGKPGSSLLCSPLIQCMGIGVTGTSAPLSDVLAISGLQELLDGVQIGKHTKAGWTSVPWALWGLGLKKSGNWGIAFKSCPHANPGTGNGEEKPAIAMVLMSSWDILFFLKCWQVCWKLQRFPRTWATKQRTDLGGMQFLVVSDTGGSFPCPRLCSGANCLECCVCLTGAFWRTGARLGSAGCKGAAGMVESKWYCPLTPGSLEYHFTLNL